MIFITGDCHGEFNRFSSSNFPGQKELTKEDIVMICGDFGGIWHYEKESAEEKYWLDWLDGKPFTTVFIDGNHENFDRLNNDYETVIFHSGKAHKIRNSVYHLMRGEIFVFDRKTFFVFGGARSHDIDDGILYRENFATNEQFRQKINQMVTQRKSFRIHKKTWWEEELPSEEEIANAEKNLLRVNFEVDYVISHCTAPSVFYAMYRYNDTPDRLTAYFEDLLHRLKFKQWFFGHYHTEGTVLEKFTTLYENIILLPTEN